MKRLHGLMGTVAVFGLMLSTASLSAQADDPVAMIESDIVMPVGAAEIAKYTRYYAWLPDGNMRGVFVMEGDGRSHLVAEEALPLVFDGGCWVVRVEYNTISGRVTQIACNGRS